MANWSLPTTTSDYATVVLQSIDAKEVDAATLFFATPTNQPDHSIRWNRSTNRFQEWSTGGAAWSDLAVSTGLSLGTMATQNSSAVSISGGSLAGVTITGSTIGATQLTGTVADARLSSNVPLKDTANAFTDTLTISKTNTFVALTIQTLSAADGYAAAEWKNSLTTGIVGVSRTAGEDLFVGSGANAFGLGTLSAHSVQIGTNGIVRLTLTSAGLTTISAANSAGHSLTLTNTTSGAGAYAVAQVVAGTTTGALYAFSQGWTTAGADVQAGVELYGSGAGGISILAGHASGVLRVYANGATQRMQVAAGVTVGDTTDPGATHLRVAGNITCLGTVAVTSTVKFGGSAANPGFLAYKSADATAQSSGATVGFNTEVYDELGEFAANVFTATVPGRYLFTAQVYMHTFSISGVAQIKLITSNRTYFGDLQSVITTDAVSQGISVIADMDAGDTAYITQIQEGTVTIKGGSDLYTYFSGRLLP